MKQDLQRIILATIFPLFLLFMLYTIKVLEVGMEWDFTQWGIYPLEEKGAFGIFAHPLIHSNFTHLLANTLPLFFLSWCLFYFYRGIAWLIFFIIWIGCGLFTFVIGKPGWHIGASGIIYGLAFFLFLSGLLRRYTPLTAISLLVTFLYGGLIWQMFPLFTPSGVSWEGHLSGAIVGSLSAFAFMNYGPQRPEPFNNEGEEDEEDDDEDEEDGEDKEEDGEEEDKDKDKDKDKEEGKEKEEEETQERNVTVRKALPEDAATLAGIYNYYIENTAVTFETVAVSEREMSERILSIVEKDFPFDVAVCDNQVVGYCYIHTWNSKCAFSATQEVTIYLDNTWTGKGIGKRLFEHLLQSIDRNRVHVLISGIRLPNEGSVRLHEKFGFKQVSCFKEVGWKFGQWQDVGHWQLILSHP